MPITTNPLRYPGAKRMLAGYIGELIEANNLGGCTFYEPYAGSAAVGLELLQARKIGKLVLCEKDTLLFAFWESVFKYSEELCRRINETDISIETWKRLCKYRNSENYTDAEIVDYGFAGLFFNRTNFSGIIDANPIGGIQQKSKYKIDCRFNKKKIIEVIQELAKYSNVVNVNHGDAIEFIKNRQSIFYAESSFVYFDPPYYEKGKQIYRYYYTGKDHIRLAELVKSIKNTDWIISYDDAPFICGLYSESGAKYQPFFMDYTCASQTRTHGHELLISNLPLPPFPVTKAAGI